MFEVCLCVRSSSPSCCDVWGVFVCQIFKPLTLWCLRCVCVSDLQAPHAVMFEVCVCVRYSNPSCCKTWPVWTLVCCTLFSSSRSVLAEQGHKFFSPSPFSSFNRRSPIKHLRLFSLPTERALCKQLFIFSIPHRLLPLTERDILNLCDYFSCLQKEFSLDLSSCFWLQQKKFFFDLDYV